VSDRADPRSPIDALTGPPPGQSAILGAGLALGMLLLAVQLWLLTIALELYLGGQGDRVWSLALISGLIFLGGLGMLWVLRRRPHVGWRTAVGRPVMDRPARAKPGAD
jgi:hypothetical protein